MFPRLSSGQHSELSLLDSIQVSLKTHSDYNCHFNYYNVKSTKVFTLYIKTIRKVERSGGENDQFWHNRASNA